MHREHHGKFSMHRRVGCSGGYVDVCTSTRRVLHDGSNAGPSDSGSQLRGREKAQT